MSTNPHSSGDQPTPFQHLARDFRERLLAVKAWTAEHEDQIGAVVGALVTYSVILPRLQRMRERFEDTEWEYLLDRVDFAAGVGLLSVLDREGTDGIVQLLEAALGRPESLPAMAGALDAYDMPVAHRKQLTEGLRHVSMREYELAVPLLMIPFEGLVSLHARDLGLIEPHKGKKHRFIDEAGLRGPVGGIEDLIKSEQLGFDEAFAAFLRLHVYGGEGDAFRHGIALEGFRHRALMVMVALLGWLSAVASTAEREQPLRKLLFDVGVASGASSRSSSSRATA